jgi:Zn-dependent membrane protease YugP
MLFEIFLLGGVSLAPLSFFILLGGLIFENKQMCQVGVGMIVVAILFFVLCFALPPIPIIPQG